jgi:hypothetical protein
MESTPLIASGPDDYDDYYANPSSSKTLIKLRSKRMRMDGATHSYQHDTQNVSTSDKAPTFENSDLKKTSRFIE